MRAFLAALAVLACAVSVSGADSFPSYTDYAGKPFTVSYDKRSIRLNDQPAVFMSGSVHYPRFSEGQWLDYLRLAKSEGLNMIEIYVFWNGHEPVEGQFNWAGRYNLTGFLDAVAEAGLFANLRIGPYVCAEWNLGGIPTWLQFNRPGIRYRSYEEQWRTAVQKWFGMVIKQTRSYFADHGGPIVLAQVENELGGADPRYVQWNGDMANAFNVGVPWLMCNGESANNTINSCNANDCTGFLSGHGQSGRILVDQPALWTENEMWFQSWGDQTVPQIGTGNNRTTEDVGFAVMRWYARGGSHHNYYMYFGGNNFGSTAGGGVATLYADGANHHADGLPNEPRYTNMNRLHRVVAEISDDLVQHPAALDHSVSLPWRTNPNSAWQNGTQQFAFEYGSTVFVESSANVWLQTQYNNQTYDMQPNSIIILRDGKVYWNSSDVKTVVSSRVYTSQWDAPFEWQGWTEPVFSPVADTDSLGASIPVTVANRPIEQLNITHDLTDYMWYSTKITTQAGENVVVTIDAATAEAFQLFIDGVSVGDAYDPSHSWISSPSQLKITVPSLTAGTHIVTLLSSSLGNQNGMEPDEDPLVNHQQGVIRGGNVTINGVDITKSQWSHRPYLVGEWLEIGKPANRGAVPWTKDSQSLVGVPVTWFTTTFPIVQRPSSGQYSILLDITGLQRGHAFVNGHDIGRYWNIQGGKSGQPTQRYYQIPADWLMWAKGQVNVLTIVDDLGVVDLSTVRIVTSQIQYGQWTADDNKSAKVTVASE